MKKKVRPCAACSKACSTRVGVPDSLDADSESKFHYGTVFHSLGSGGDHQKSTSKSRYILMGGLKQAVNGSLTPSRSKAYR
jgi:hypothetical protein